MLRETESSSSATKYLIQWVLSQADVWYLLYRCADYVSKAQAPIQTSAVALDQLFALDDVDSMAGPSDEGADAVENRQVPECSWWRSKCSHFTFVLNSIFTYTHTPELDLKMSHGKHLKSIK